MSYWVIDLGQQWPIQWFVASSKLLHELMLIDHNRCCVAFTLSQEVLMNLIHSLCLGNPILWILPYTAGASYLAFEDLYKKPLKIPNLILTRLCHRRPWRHVSIVKSRWRQLYMKLCDIRDEHMIVKGNYVLDPNVFFVRNRWTYIV